MITAAIIFVRTGIAGAFNYQYNLNSIQSDYKESLEFFKYLSIWLMPPYSQSAQSCSLPFATCAVSIVGRQKRETSIRTGTRCCLESRTPRRNNRRLLWLSLEFFSLLHFDSKRSLHHATAQSSSFKPGDLRGFAWIYPFFGISLVATLIYYPSLVAPTMMISDSTVECQTHYSPPR